MPGIPQLRAMWPSHNGDFGVQKHCHKVLGPVLSIRVSKSNNEYEYVRFERDMCIIYDRLSLNIHP